MALGEAGLQDRILPNLGVRTLQLLPSLASFPSLLDQSFQAQQNAHYAKAGLLLSIVMVHAAAWREVYLSAEREV